LAALPHALAHNDLWTRNAFAGSDRAAILIDWSMCGYAPLGSDAVNLVYDSAWMFDLSAERLRQLVPVVRAAYADGVTETDPSLSRSLLERAFGRIAALRFGLLLGSLLETCANPHTHAALEARYGRSMESIVSERVAVVRSALTLLTES